MFTLSKFIDTPSLCYAAYLLCLHSTLLNQLLLKSKAAIPKIKSYREGPNIYRS